MSYRSTIGIAAVRKNAAPIKKCAIAGAIGVLDGERRKIPGSERYSADVTDINESD